MAQSQMMHVPPGFEFLRRWYGVVKCPGQRLDKNLAVRLHNIARHSAAEISHRGERAHPVFTEAGRVETPQEIEESGFERDRRCRIGGVIAVPPGDRFQHGTRRRV